MRRDLIGIILNIPAGLSLLLLFTGVVVCIHQGYIFTEDGSGSLGAQMCLNGFSMLLVFGCMVVGNIYDQTHPAVEIEAYDFLQITGRDLYL